MKTNAVFLNRVRCQPGTMPVALFVAAAVLLGAFCGTASAKRHALIGRDGKIHACYRVKGKPKGELRVVRSPRAHCRRGERKVAWSVAPTASVPGASGQQGSQGQQGSGGTSGTSSDEAALKAQISALSLKVESLEGLLNGVGSGGLVSKVDGLEGLLSGVEEPGDLSDAVNTLGGVTKQELEDTVGALPSLEEACVQTEELTERSDALLGFINSLDTLNLLTNLPGDLPSFENVCPAP